MYSIIESFFLRIYIPKDNGLSNKSSRIKVIIWFKFLIFILMMIRRTDIIIIYNQREHRFEKME